MDKMKYDMSGGSAVLGVFHALRRLRPAVRVVGLVPLTENMPGGHAIKPGDILTAANGLTIEVTNTDAEGRLVLADALAYAKRFKPDAVIDLATLTGAVVVALGSVATGVLGNNAGLVERVRRAGERTGERVWELPMWPDYAELMRSDVADIKNAGIREAGTIQGAIFLSNFVDGAPWAHLDIAGTAWNEKDKPYGPKGATGVGVRMLLDLVENWGEKRQA
jgi:leucyl aminopeptidase